MMVWSHQHLKWKHVGGKSVIQEEPSWMTLNLVIDLGVVNNAIDTTWSVSGINGIVNDPIKGLTPEFPHQSDRNEEASWIRDEMSSGSITEFSRPRFNSFWITTTWTTENLHRREINYLTESQQSVDSLKRGGVYTTIQIILLFRFNFGAIHIKIN